MAITDIRNPGSRLSMTNPARWGRRKPVEVAEQAAAPAAQAVEETTETAGNVDLSLRDRIRRLSRRPEQNDDSSNMRRAPRAEEGPVTSFTQAPPRDRASEAQQNRPVRQVPSRQSARPRRDRQAQPPREENTLPATRRTSAPEPHAERLVASKDETDAMRSEIKELRAEIAAMREEMNGLRSGADQGGGGSVRAVEKAVQRLAERMDNVDGGAPLRPQIAEARAPRRIGLMERLFGR